MPTSPRPVDPGPIAIAREAEDLEISGASRSSTIAADHSARAKERRRPVGLALWLGAIMALPLWAVAYPPLQDYPYHLVRAQIVAEWSHPWFSYPETFSRDLFPTPYILSDYLMAGIGAALGAPVAGKVVLSLYLVLFPASLLWWLSAVGPGRAPLALLGIPLAFNWHFHMGFLGYTLSLVAALFAAGWWWRTRERSGWGLVVVLAALTTLVYLLHLYTWGILFAALAAMAVASPQRWRQLGVLALAYLPGAALLLALLARVPGSGEPHAWLLLYGNPAQRAELAVGSLLSFSPLVEGLLILALATVVLPMLAAGWRRGIPRELLAAVAALAGLFLLLPDHVGDVYFVSNRVPLVLLLFAAGALALPADPRRRRWAVGVLGAVAVLYLGTVAWRYHQIDGRLGDYAAILGAIPPQSRAGFRAHRPSMREGRIAPAAIFGGYHYLKAPGDRIPDLDHFVGFLRPVSYRDREGETMSTAGLRSRAEIASVLGRRHMARAGGVLLRVGGSVPERSLVDEVASEQGWKRLGGVGVAAIYLKGREGPLEAPAIEPPTPGPEVGDPPAAAPTDDTWYATGYLEEADYLAVYAHPEIPSPAETSGFELVLVQGAARLYQRAPGTKEPAPRDPKTEEPPRASPPAAPASPGEAPGGGDPAVEG